MLSSFQGLYTLLIISLALNLTAGVNVGCDDWTVSGQHEVCCDKCKPGNRLVQRCGVLPENLCTPCEPGTYSDRTDFRCRTCNQCIGIQITVKPCTITSDTVCGCKPGYRCGDKTCSYCVTECKEGQEPIENRLCRTCPEGKFNDKVHSMCKEWKKSCPDGFILKKGNITNDSTCISSDKIPKPVTSLVRRTNEEKTNWLPVFIAAVMAGFAVLCILFSLVACVKSQNKMEKKTQSDSTEEDSGDSSGDSRIMVIEQEDCSFRHPEQEQSGSSESINTENSKLIV